jgi:hypothetical protein
MESLVKANADALCERVSEYEEPGRLRAQGDVLHDAVSESEAVCAKRISDGPPAGAEVEVPAEIVVVGP